MSIPSKRARRIEIDERWYLYIVKETHVPGHCDQKQLMVVIQEAVERPGAPLYFRWNYGCPVTPALLVDVVRSAKVAGWDPSARGRAVEWKGVLA